VTPKQQAINLYNGNAVRYVGERHLIRRLPQGRTIETPACCLWGFPIQLTPRLLKHGTVTIHHEPDPDCWMVWLCTGDLESVLHLIPYPLPYVAFARDNRLRGYSFEKLTRKLMKSLPPIQWHRHPEQQHQFGGGGGGGGPSKTAKENEKLNNQLLKQQLAAMGKEQPEMPAFIPPPAPKYAPPPSQTSQDAEAAAQEFRRASKMRRGFARSKLGAGDTGRPSTSTPSTPAPVATAQGAKSTLG
jgi:hypothetical protein